MFDWALIKMDRKPIRWIKSIQIIQGSVQHNSMKSGSSGLVSLCDHGLVLSPDDTDDNYFSILIN